MKQTRSEEVGLPPGIGRRAVPTLVVALVLAACGPSGPVEIEESRIYRPLSEPIRWNVSASERLLDRRPPDPPRFAWDLPEGWGALPTNQFRQANFRIAAQPDVECYMSMVTGGALANLSRWRGQMGLSGLTQGQVDELRREEFLGQQAYYVELEGTFTGMGGPPRPDFMLVGVVMEVLQRTVTLKMIGPKHGVDGERERFLALAASFQVAPGQGGAPAPQGAGSLTWRSPEGWRAAPTRIMTEVVYAVGTGTACWIAILGRNAGGVEANIQRWRSQMGGAPVVVQESLPMFGTQGSMIEIHGPYAGDSAGPAIEDAAMLAASCGIDNRTVFVKMIGPREEVQAHRAEFLEFCASLRQ